MNLRLTLLTLCFISSSSLVNPEDPLKLSCKFSVKKSIGKTCTISGVKIPKSGKSSKIVTMKNPEIEQIIFENSTVASLPTDLFKRFPKLNKLVIRNSKLKMEDREFFRDARNIKTLSLENNDLESLDDNVFSLLRNLESIDLSENRIEYISKHLLSRNSKLKSINLEKNEIFMIDLRFLDFLENLEEFELRDNVCVNKSLYFKPNKYDMLRKMLENCYHNYQKFGFPYKNLRKLEKVLNQTQYLNSSNHFLEIISQNISKVSGGIKNLKVIDHIKVLEKTFSIYHDDEISVLKDAMKDLSESLDKLRQDNWTSIFRRFKKFEDKLKISSRNFSKRHIFDDEFLLLNAVYEKLEGFNEKVVDFNNATLDKILEKLESSKCQVVKKDELVNDDDDDVRKQLKQQKDFLSLLFLFLAVLILINFFVIFIAVLIYRELRLAKLQSESFENPIVRAYN